MNIKKTRILYITCFASLKGGGQRSLRLLLENIDKREFEPYLVVPGDGELKKAAEALGVKTFVVPLARLRSLNVAAVLRGFVRIKRIVSSELISLISTDSDRQTVYAAAAGFFCRVPVLLHLRVTESRPWIDKLLYLLTARMIAVSEAAAERFKGIDRAGKVTVVYNGVDLDAFKPCFTNERRKGLRIGYFGRLEERKGVDIFINAVKALDDPLLEAFIIGDGEPAYAGFLKGLAAGFSRIHFEGFREEVAKDMAGMDAVILPSRWGEGLSRTVIEAMALGKPVIVSEIPSNPELVGPELRHLVFKTGDIKGLAGLIGAIIKDRALLEQAGRTARQRAEVFFDIRKNTRAIESVYRSVVKQREIRKIIVVNLGGLGDVLLSSPSLKALRNFFPQARITFLGVSRTCGLVKNFSFIDEVMAFGMYNEQARRFSLSGSLGLVRTLFCLRAGQFDLAINMRTIVSWPGALKMALLFIALGVPYRLGRDTGGRGFFLNLKIPETNIGDKHEMDYDLETIGLIGADVRSRSFDKTIFGECGVAFDGRLKAEGICASDCIVVVNPGGLPSRRWPVENFIEVIRWLLGRFSCKIAVTGGISETGLSKALKEHLGDTVIDLIGKLSISELSALINRASLLITNDTGPMHMGAILNVPMVAIFGGGHLTRFDPRGISGAAVVLDRKVECAPCNRPVCPSMKCLKEIAVEDVTGAVLKFSSGLKGKG